MSPSRADTFSLPLGERPLIRARFLTRPNRFLVSCEAEGLGRVKAFLPNPGRLLELLLPDVILYLLPNAPDAPPRATDYTVLAVERDKRPVLLHTHWCNVMARRLLDARAVPGLETMQVVRQEVQVGRSRFDFLLQDDNRRCYVEVKSCALFGNGTAMFPDAVTARGRRHLLELADIAQEQNTACRVLFIVQTDTARCFMPDYHTDPDFAHAMLSVRHHVPIVPLPITWDSRLRFRVSGPPLPTPWEHVAKENCDCGAYLLVLRLDTPHVVKTGSLGTRRYLPGWYVYVGSAMKGLNARMARHRRKRKRKHWHIDYLRDVAEYVDCLPIRSTTRMECDIARDMAANSNGITGFGCSDCACAAHLFHHTNNPLHDREFHNLLQRYRMAEYPG